MSIVACAVILLLVAPSLVPVTAAYASSHTDKLLKKILHEQKIQTALNQDNQNATATRLNTMLLYIQNILAHLEIISQAQIKH